MGKKVAKRARFSARQEQFLELAARSEYFSNRFYLTGGTALSAVYYNHRVSNDLDFFTSEPINPRELSSYIHTLGFKLGVKSMGRQVSHNINGYIFEWDADLLKVEFLYYAFPRLEKGDSYEGIAVDSILDIGVNKLDTILSRKKARDYVDLYTILHREKFDLEYLRRMHERKMQIKVDSLTWAKVFLQVNEVNDFPKMKVRFSYERMVDFFEREARKLKTEIFK